MTSTFRLCALLLLFVTSHSRAWEPGTGTPNAVAGFVVDTTDRSDVLSFYNCIYSASEGFESRMSWTGNIGTCSAGATSAAFKDDVRRRINFYRGLVSLPADIVFESGKNADAQQAALMMSANRSLSHSPSTNWPCYTVAGRDAAAASNLALGNHGPDAIDAYIFDDGSNNIRVGHRRWLLYPRAQSMGTGDVPSSANYLAANAVWVIGDFKPAPAPKFVAWPNSGFSPVTLAPDRWSLSYPGADFSSATVSMRRGDTNIPANIISRNENVGDRALVWEPTGIPATVADDTTYSVTVSNISGAGVPTTHSYEVTLFDPNILGDAAIISGSLTPPTTGATYNFNAIASADAYELRVASSVPADFVEGAEDTPIPQIADDTTGNYDLRQTEVKRTGSKAFHLAFPGFEHQSFTVLRDVIPTGNSQLNFHDMGRFATNSSILSAEVSANGGATWTSVFDRRGVGLSSSLWDASFVSRSVSLAAFAGETIQVRFILRYSGSTSIGTGNTHGFFIDDISITGATELVGATTTTLSGDATSFELNANTAGGSPSVGQQYFMRIRPNVGCRWFGDGPLLAVTAQAQTSSGYASWIANQYPDVSGGPAADYEGDGLSNGVEYAFGFNPVSPTPANALPQLQRSGNTYSATFPHTQGVTGVLMTAEWSTDLNSWTEITDSGTAANHTFAFNSGGAAQVFFRYRVSVTE